MRLAVKKDAVEVEFDWSKDSREAGYGAAYLFMDRMFASFSSAGKKVRLTLRPKGPLDLKAFAAAFQDEYQTQQLRWAIARQTLPIREFIVQQAIQKAQGGGASAAPPEPEALTAEQKAEIDRLIAEVEEELRDSSARKSAADPKGIAATWEERHGRSG